MSWLLLIIAAFANAGANLLLQKSATLGVGIGQYFSYYFLIGLSLFGLNILLYAKALEGVHVSLGYPVLVGIGVAVITLFSLLVEGKQFNISQVVGMLLVLAGIGLLSK